MRIIDFAVKNAAFTTIFFVALTLLGWNALQTIPRSEDPQIDIPIYVITLIYPGAAPEDLEQLVVDPIEDELKELDDIKEIRSTMQDGVAVVVIEFESGVNPDDKYDEVLRQVNAIRDDLPEQLAKIDVDQVDPNDVRILQAALVSETASFAELKIEAERLEDRLERVSGVLQSDIYGLPDQEIRVALNLSRMAELGVSPFAVIRAIQSESVNLPGGGLELGGRKFTVKTSGSLETIDRIKSTVVSGAQGGYIRVGDIADVRQETEDVVATTRINGQRCVFVTATQKDNQNIFLTQEGIDKALAETTKLLPAKMKLQIGHVQADNVEHRLSHLLRDFALAIGLVLLTLLPLGTRASLVVMISIPLSLLIGVAMLKLTGYSINQLSIVGLVIALGLLVDDSIVVIENISRFLREGYKPVEAALAATKQISVAVIGTTATLIFAFIPLTQLPGTAGDFIRSLPMAVIFTIVASLLVALTIIPFLASRILRPSDDPEGNWLLKRVRHAIEITYRPILHWSLSNPSKTLIAAGLLFLGSFALVPAIGFSLFPKADIPMYLVTVEGPDGTTLRKVDEAIKFVEAAVSGHPNVKAVMTTVGDGNPRIYYNVTPNNERENVGELFVRLHSYDPDETPLYVDSLRKRFASYPGMKIRIKEFENGPPIDAPIAMRIVGPNLDTLRLLSAQMAATMEATAGTRDVEDPLRESKTDIRVAVDVERATGLFGIPTADVDQTVRLVLAGITAGTYRTSDGDEYDIRVTSPYVNRPTLAQLDQVHLTNSLGRQVPLRQVADVTFESSASKITHFDRERSVTVSANVQSGFNTDRVTKELLGKIEQLTIPSGYRIVPGGEIESRQESFGDLSSAIMIAIFGIFAILILEFKTVKSTLIVLSVVPLGVIGGLLALFLSGYTLSFVAVIGFVALVGIEIKNSLLLVDFTNQLRRQGVGLDEAIEQAGEIRFLPILLTTMTAIGGLIPLVLEQVALYSPLALVIIGGLITSTLLTRLVTPVMYKLLAPAV